MSPTLQQARAEADRLQRRADAFEAIWSSVTMTGGIILVGASMAAIWALFVTLAALVTP